MANFFSAAFWKARFFKTMGGESAIDPNAMSGTFAGTSTLNGTISETETSDETELGGRPIRRRRRRGSGYEPPHSEFWDKEPIAARVSPEDAPPPGIAAPIAPKKQKKKNRDWLRALFGTSSPPATSFEAPEIIDLTAAIATADVALKKIEDAQEDEEELLLLLM